MYRKTNLFYIEGNDSNFLMFSNYSEYLTGTFLSTSAKMFPSSFLAFDLPFDSTNTIKDFKIFLMKYYENKLAVLRDKYEAEGKKFEDCTYPLVYLLEAIYNYFGNKKGIWKKDIAYIGDIVEQDYNGNYADTICIVDFNRYYTGSVENIDHYAHNIIEKQEQYLHGWNDEDKIIEDSIIDMLNPLWDRDDENAPYLNSYENISISKIEETNSRDISFNCIVPLFDIFDIDETTYKALKEEGEFTVTNINLASNNTDDYTIYKNIPYGIWFASENNGVVNNIKLHKDDAGFGQTWSLVISSKFAPFPYGIHYQNAEPSDNVALQNTYAELLAEQASLLARFNAALDKISDLNNQIIALKATISAMGTLQNIDSIKNEFNNKIDNIYQEFNNYKVEINERLAGLRWKNLQ